ncbi:MAG: alginate export family protein [Planctomycetota bacterium]
MVGRRALAVLLAVLTPVPAALAGGPDEPRLGLGYLRRGQTVEARGRFEGGRFRAETIDVEDPDDEVTLKGPLQSYEAGVSADIGGVGFVIVRKARVVDDAGAGVVPGAWAKAECVHRGGKLRLRKLTLRPRRDDEQEEIEGRIEAIDIRRGHLTIGGVQVSFDADVRVSWDVEGRPPPPPQERALDSVSRVAGGLRRIRTVDEEDRRPEAQLTLWDFVTVGGEVQYDLDWRKNFDLRDSRRRDLLVHELSARLELSFDLGARWFAFVKAGVNRKFVGFDQDRDLEFDTDFILEESWFQVDGVGLPGLSLQVGRQDFDHGREWVMDDQLDAVRAHLDLDRVALQASVSTVLAGHAPEEEDVVNVLVAAEWEPWPDVELFLYGLHRSGGRLVELSRTHVGLSLEAEVRDWTVWLDVAWVSGDEDGLDVAGAGFDLMVMRELKDTPLAPYFYASADPDPATGRELGFRQSGLHDNNARLGGVEGFRYLGELVRPELSNLMVLTAGFGFRPAPRVSVDLLYHHYEQVEAAPFLQDTRIRRDPNGLSRNVGDAFDLVVGIDRWHRFGVEIVLGWFLPGSAFDRRDHAMFLGFQLEWNF